MTQTDLAPGIMAFFVRLLQVDARTMVVADKILGAIGALYARSSRFELSADGWGLNEIFDTVPVGRAKRLLEAVDHEDAAVRTGTYALIATLAKAYRVAGSDVAGRLRRLPLDRRIGLLLLASADGRVRRQGIQLLAALGMPVDEEEVRVEVLGRIASAREVLEVTAWGELLRGVPVPSAQEKHWASFLESILAQPQRYVAGILADAMRRYTSLFAGSETVMISPSG
jgi:hypothetical protein